MKMKKIIEIITFADFKKNLLNLIKLEIIVIYQVNTDVQLIVNVMLMLHRSKVILYHLYFITFLILIVICSSKN